MGGLGCARPRPRAWTGYSLEVHENPAEVKSGGANALHLKNLEAVLQELLTIRKALAAR